MPERAGMGSRMRGGIEARELAGERKAGPRSGPQGKGRSRKRRRRQEVACKNSDPKNMTMYDCIGIFKIRIRT